MMDSPVKTRLFISGTKVDCVETVDVISAMEGWIRNRQLHNYVVTSNANNVVLGKSNESLQKAVNSSSLSVADGISLVIVARLRGYALNRRVYGPDLMLEFLRISEVKGYSNFFYGSTDETLKLLVKSLKMMFPRLRIAGYHSPPFSASVHSEKKEIEIINKSCPDVVWVGLGGVKQELWMYESKDELSVPVLIGVGAAFDFLAGSKRQAPLWIRNNGFEWLFRLITEPKRLWRRYLINNFLFIYYAGIELLLSVFAFRRIKSN